VARGREQHSLSNSTSSLNFSLILLDFDLNVDGQLFSL
jgi:hypothetical protein